MPEIRTGMPSSPSVIRVAIEPSEGWTGRREKHPPQMGEEPDDELRELLIDRPEAELPPNPE